MEYSLCINHASYLVLGHHHTTRAADSVMTFLNGPIVIKIGCTVTNHCYKCLLVWFPCTDETVSPPLDQGLSLLTRISAVKTCVEAVKGPGQICNLHPKLQSGS